MQRRNLFIASKALPRANELEAAAHGLGWRTSWSTLPSGHSSDEGWAYYGGVDVAVQFGRAVGHVMLEAPLDHLSRISPDLLLREVRSLRFEDLKDIGGQWFVKPADSLAKVFDAGVYRDLSGMNLRRPIDPKTPVLISEPVEWLAEYRVWIMDGHVLTTSQYMSFGMPLCHRAGAKGLEDPRSVMAFCDRVLSEPGLRWPPAFVMDVGLVEGRGWGVVELNPIWCSALYSGEVAPILPALGKVCLPKRLLTKQDEAWVIRDW